MKQFSSLILANNRISEDFFQLDLSWSPDIITPQPGQFLTLRISEQAVPLLRRPFAISGFNRNNNSASIIYQRRGRGTELLAAKMPGDTIDTIAPLGNSFPIPHKEQKAILVAGGIGLGPILYLSKVLRENHINTTFVFGCRNQAFIPRGESFSSENPQICTDDGSAGFKGNVSDYLLSISSSVSSQAVLYSCGPHPMLHACHQFAEKKGIQCWVSVEQIMACGVGACMGCVVKIIKEPGYARACKEGPVFSSDALVW